MRANKRFLSWNRISTLKKALVPTFISLDVLFKFIVDRINSTTMRANIYKLLHLGKREVGLRLKGLLVIYSLWKMFYSIEIVHFFHFFERDIHAFEIFPFYHSIKSFWNKEGLKWLVQTRKGITFSWLQFSDYRLTICEILAFFFQKPCVI